MKFQTTCFLLLAALSLFSPVRGGAEGAAPGPVLTVTPDHPSALYAVGEKATWTVDVKSGDRAALTAVPYSVKRDGADEVAQGTLDLSSGPATLGASLADPGMLLATFYSMEKPASEKAPRPVLGLGGAIFGAEKIGPTSPVPDDFDAFWQGKLAELAAVPMNPVVEPGAGDPPQRADGVDYYKVTLDNIHGAHVQGQLARPRAGEKFPAILMLQYAGVYPLLKQPVLNQAREGWLVLNIEAHDIPIEGPPELYADLQKNALNDYPHKGNEDRDQSYFVQMFLGCVRAAAYLASRPDWDGKILVATGASQGGLQSLAVAALFPKISHVMVVAPAGCDIDAPLAVPARGAGWPYWMGPWAGAGRDMKKVRETAHYFDGISFASRVKCPVLIGVGAIDETARPTGVIAAYNALPNAKGKELVVLPFANHHGSNHSSHPYDLRAKEWKDALKAGTDIPPANQAADAPAPGGNMTPAS